MRTIAFLLLFLITASAIGQSEALAKNYLDQGEYKKAIAVYGKLYEKSPGRMDYLKALVVSNQQDENFQEAERLLKEKLNSRRINPQLFVDLGYNYSIQNLDTEANANYNLAMQAVEEYPNYVYSIGKAFEDYSLLDYASNVYEIAMQQNPALDFNIQLARIYGEQGKLEEMFL